ncbi:MAG: LysR family transcriptional regulator [Caldilineales bacterium]|nr:LysR family transcriptional regulator [Caldilineales bacterium]
MPALPPLKPRVNVWLEVEDEVALSRWRIRLLQMVDRTGSISAAAESMGIQYRLAWQRIHEMEERLGIALVHASAGGRGGGGSTLTAEAQALIAQFTAMIEAIDACATEHYAAQFHPTPSDAP